jgi:hypothetical protein
MIELDVNGRSTGIEPASIPDLRAMVGRALPSEHVVCTLRVNGREVPESGLEELELRAIRRLEVKSATPRDLAYQALGETREWIGRICDVLQSVARDYRLGRDKDAHERMASVADALQVLAGLLHGIWAFVDSDPGVRGRLQGPWSEAEAGLRRSIEGLIEDMESGDPVRLADHAGYLLPRSLERFHDILGRIAR